MVGTVASLRCYIGPPWSATSQTCPYGSRCATATDGTGTRSCIDSSGCSVSGVSCCSGDNCNDPNPKLRCYIGASSNAISQTCQFNNPHNARCSIVNKTGVRSCMDYRECMDTSGVWCCSEDNCNAPSGSGGGGSGGKPYMSIASKTMCGALTFTSLLALFLFQ